MDRHHPAKAKQNASATRNWRYRNFDGRSPRGASGIDRVPGFRTSKRCTSLRNVSHVWGAASWILGSFVSDLDQLLGMRGRW
jgi:hypothetical protein